MSDEDKPRILEITTPAPKEAPPPGPPHYRVLLSRPSTQLGVSRPRPPPHVRKARLPRANLLLVSAILVLLLSNGILAYLYFVQEDQNQTLASEIGQDQDRISRLEEQNGELEKSVALRDWLFSARARITAEGSGGPVYSDGKHCTPVSIKLVFASLRSHDLAGTVRINISLTDYNGRVIDSDKRVESWLDFAADQEYVFPRTIDTLVVGPYELRMDILYRDGNITKRVDREIGWEVYDDVVPPVIIGSRSNKVGSIITVLAQVRDNVPIGVEAVTMFAWTPVSTAVSANVTIAPLWILADNEFMYWDESEKVYKYAFDIKGPLVQPGAYIVYTVEARDTSGNVARSGMHRISVETGQDETYASSSSDLTIGRIQEVLFYPPTCVPQICLGSLLPVRFLWSDSARQR